MEALNALACFVHPGLLSCESDKAPISKPFPEPFKNHNSNGDDFQFAQPLISHRALVRVKMYQGQLYRWIEVQHHILAKDALVAAELDLLSVLSRHTECEDS